MSDVTACEDRGGASQNSTEDEYVVDGTVQHVEEISGTKYVVGRYSCNAKADSLEPGKHFLRQLVRMGQATADDRDGSLLDFKVFLNADINPRWYVRTVVEPTITVTLEPTLNERQRNLTVLCPKQTLNPRK